MSVEKILNVGPSKIEIAYERFGDILAPPVILIMGLGAQMLSWHEDFCEELVARGLQVIRFDNRDVGLSTHLHDAPTPDFAAALAGDYSSVSYRLSDMAADTIALMDALGLKSAHLVGASMGGFIAQTIAIEYPQRVRSLTSIMSTTGDIKVGQLKPEARAIFGGPQPTNREEVMEQALRSFRIVGSRGFPFDENEVRERAGLAYDRAYDPLGLIRQAVAVIASGDRTEKLQEIKVPTLVIHGADDVMCDVSGGEATAKAIPGAKLVIMEGMGHSLPRDLWPRIVSLISDLVQRAESLERMGS
jgi:pimeloyl-ACP methyl ester carboxylesterase